MQVACVLRVPQYGGVVLDADVRQVLRCCLFREHSAEPDTRVLDELDLCGTARVDVAVVNGALAGYEIKSARDTLRRLPLQVQIYSEVLDLATLVVAENHLAEASKIVPAWWGLCVASGLSDGVSLEFVRAASRNPAPEACSIVQLLWREEALRALEARGLDQGVRSKPRAAMWHRMVSEMPLSEIQDSVREALKQRTGWKGQS